MWVCECFSIQSFFVKRKLKQCGGCLQKRNSIHFCSFSCSLCKGVCLFVKFFLNFFHNYIHNISRKILLFLARTRSHTQKWLLCWLFYCFLFCYCVYTWTEFRAARNTFNPTHSRARFTSQPRGVAYFCECSTRILRREACRLLFFLWNCKCIFLFCFAVEGEYSSTALAFNSLEFFAGDLFQVKLKIILRDSMMTFVCCSVTTLSESCYNQSR